MLGRVLGHVKDTGGVYRMKGKMLHPLSCVFYAYGEAGRVRVNFQEWPLTIKSRPLKFPNPHSSQNRA
jgi:hypothetical protein